MNYQEKPVMGNNDHQDIPGNPSVATSSYKKLNNRSEKTPLRVLSEKDWDFLQVKFLTMHQYFTKSAKLRRDPEKQKRIVELKEVLKKYEEGDE